MKTIMKRKCAPRWTFKLLHESVKGLGCLPYYDPQDHSWYRSWYSWVSSIPIEGRLKFLYDPSYESLGLIFIKTQIYV